MRLVCRLEGIEKRLENLRLTLCGLRQGGRAAGSEEEPSRLQFTPTLSRVSRGGGAEMQGFAHFGGIFNPHLIKKKLKQLPVVY